MNAQPLETLVERIVRQLGYATYMALIAVMILVAATAERIQAQPSPEIDIQRSVLLSWPELDDDYIIVSQASVGEAWIPCLEPIFKRFGELCVAASSANPSMRLFKTMRGFQFTDDFSQLNWEPAGINEADQAKFTLSPADRALRIHGDAAKPSGPGFAVLPSDPSSTACHDLAMSLDILDWDTEAVHQTIGFACRIGEYPQAYLPCLITGDTEIGGQASLSFFEASRGKFGRTPVDLEAHRPVRLVLTAVGTELSLALFYLDDLSVSIETATATDPSFSEGSVGLWVWSGSEFSSYDVTIDNFVVTGTRP